MAKEKSPISRKHKMRLERAGKIMTLIIPCKVCRDERTVEVDTGVTFYLGVGNFKHKVKGKRRRFLQVKDEKGVRYFLWVGKEKGVKMDVVHCFNPLIKLEYEFCIEHFKK